MVHTKLEKVKNSIGEPLFRVPNQITIIYILLSLVLLIIIIRKAWCGDDAYITFRVIDNFVNGYGLRFNIGERVQAFTNPFWLFLLTPFYLAFGKIELVSAGTSLLLTGLNLFIIVKFAKNKDWKLILLLVFLIFSRAFTDFSSSGLENPLSHFLITIFILFFFENLASKKSIIFLAIITSLLLLNRMDLGLIVLPGLVWTFIEKPEWKRLLYFGIGLIPIFLWEIFSFIYYGFPFPNTAYAKLNAGIPVGEYLVRGLLYYVQLISFDPVTFIVIISVTFCGLVFGISGKLKAISLGGALYLVYIVWIGGDFMMGRYFSTLLIVCLVILLQFDFTLSSQKTAILCLCAFCLSTFLSETPVYVIGKDEGSINVDYLSGISDARKEYMANNLVLSYRVGEKGTRHIWKDQGLEDRKKFFETGEYQIIDAGPIGMRGFFAGPTVHLIDTYAISDPLLARLPSEIRNTWRPGHLYRSIPDGYLETIKSGKNRIVDENLSQYYDRLKDIVSGPIFDRRRLISIVKMNFGLYDYLIDTDKYRHAGIQHIRLACDFGICESIYGKNISFNDSGLEIRLDKSTNLENLTVMCTIRLRKIRVLFFDDPGKLVDDQSLEGWGGFNIIPEKSASKVLIGRIKIYPLEGSGSYQLTSLTVLPLNHP